MSQLRAPLFYGIMAPRCVARRCSFKAPYEEKAMRHLVVLTFLAKLTWILIGTTCLMLFVRSGYQLTASKEPDSLTMLGL